MNFYSVYAIYCFVLFIVVANRFKFQKVKTALYLVCGKFEDAGQNR